MNTEIFPLLSIVCITYNHKNFINDTINGFLSQKTNFHFEILIGEDCSTDGTREIVFQYQEKYPDLIKIITSETNVGMYQNGIRTYNAAKGKYIAVCEGDDYWTDTDKLQKQVDFLEQNPNFALSHHRVLIFEQCTGKKVISNPLQNEITSIRDLAYYNYIYTTSCVFRNNIKSIPDWFKNCIVGDYPLHLFNATYGKIKFFPEIMAVYRIHNTNTWATQNYIEILKKWAKMLEQLSDKFDNVTNNNLKTQRQKNLLTILSHAIRKLYFSDMKYSINELNVSTMGLFLVFVKIQFLNFKRLCQYIKFYTQSLHR